MEMQVENGLTCGGPIQLRDHDAGRLESLFDRKRDLLHSLNRSPQDHGICLVNVLRRVLGNDQSVPIDLGHDIHKGQ